MTISITLYILFLLWAFCAGGLASMGALIFLRHQKDAASKKEINNYFNEIFECILQDRSKFMSRLSNYVQIECNINNKIIILGFDLDKRSLHTFKDNDIDKTEFNLSLDIKEAILNIIDLKYRSKIDNIIKMPNGVVIDIDTYNKQMNAVKNYPVDDFLRNMEKKNIEKSPQFDLDEILEKIHDKGIESLTKQELEFLNSHSEKK